MKITQSNIVTLCLFLLLINPDAHSKTMPKRAIPGAQVAATVGSQALWYNPAGLAFMGGGEGGLSYLYEWSEPGNRHHGGADIALNMWERLTLAGGLSTQAALTSKSKKSLGTDLNGIFGAGIRLSKNTAFGISFLKYHNFSKRSSSPTLIDFGFQSRPFSFLSLGFNYEEVNPGYFSAANIIAGLSFRPYKEYLTVGIDGKWVPKGLDFGDGFNLHPILSLRGDLAGYGAAISTEFPGVRDGFSKPIFSFALEFNLAKIGLSISSLINPSANNFALGSHIRTSSEEWESITRPKGLWVALNIDSDGTLEQRPSSLMEQLLSSAQSPLSVLALLKRIESDASIEGVLLNLAGFSFGDGRTQEWRDAILSLKQAKKTVWVYLDSPSERDYYIATAADKIFMNEQATLSLANFQATMLYFADLLEKIGVKAEAIVAGNYKTAPRQFTNARPQKEEIEVMSNILDSFYERLLENTSSDRQIGHERLKALFDKGEISASEAHESGLVDMLTSSLLESRSEPFSHLPLYPDYEKRTFKRNAWHPAKRIAVIPINDTIVDGHIYPGIFSGFSPATGAKDVVDEIENAIEDDDIIGIIIRINSPGGDALAGHRINQALMKAKEIKPIVASMSDVAASAGYLIAAGTNHILAMPNTITGSIGVFSLMFSAEKLAQKIGVYAEELSAIKNPGGTTFRSLSPEERREAQRLIDWAYHNFIKAVSTGINLDEAKVRKNADGHVWLGEQALEKKLVNELGGFAKAIEAVRLLAEIPEDQGTIIDVRVPGSNERFAFTTSIMSLFRGQKADIRIEHLKALATPYLKAMEAYRLHGQPQARLPFDITWKSKRQPK